MDRIDILAFAPHPDDVELYCSGALLELKRLGRTIGIVDLTRGELSTRGNPELRAEETRAANAVLELDVRINLGIPDGNIANTPEHRLRVIEALRRLRPETVLLPYSEDRHPDHPHASQLVRESCFYSGLSRIPSFFEGREQEAYRPPRLFYYMLDRDINPSILIDVSASVQKKREAIRCYASQFASGRGREEPETYISTQSFMEALEARMRRLGFSIGVAYAEGFLPAQPFGGSAELLLNSYPR